MTLKELIQKMPLQVQAALQIETARKLAGLTQTQLATRMNIKQPAIARLESASNAPTLNTLDELRTHIPLDVHVSVADPRIKNTGTVTFHS